MSIGLRYLMLAIGSIDFAFVGYCALGSYVTLVVGGKLNWPYWAAISCGVLFSSLIGWLCYVSIYRILQARSDKLWVRFAISIALYTVIQNVISLGFGDSIQVFPNLMRRPVDIAGIRVSTLEVVCLAMAIMAGIFHAWHLQKHPSGIVLRATADNAVLSEVFSINLLRARSSAVVIGALFGFAAVLVAALDSSITPTSGFELEMQGIAVVLLAWGRPSTLVVGALCISLGRNLFSFYVSNEWADGALYGLLFTYLMLRHGPILKFGSPATEI